MSTFDLLAVLTATCVAVCLSILVQGLTLGPLVSRLLRASR